MHDRFHDIRTAANGTCEWLSRHEIYKSWATSDRSLLWIKGKPGSGKSTLLKYTLENCEAERDALVLSFFFHGRGDELQKTPLGLFRSLLHQILRHAPQALLDLIDTFEKRSKEIGKPGEKWQWNSHELHRFFKSSLPKVLESRPVRLFVDALDECGKDNAIELVDNFKSLLDLPALSSHFKQLRVCFSCRHYPILDVGGIFEVQLERESKEDISTFVKNSLSAFSTWTLSSEIPILITHRANGVFLWARLVVQRVLELYRDGYGPKDIEAAIGAIPLDLYTLYEELIQDMGSDSEKLIQWICSATRPLSIDEMRWAMIIEADSSYLSLQECQSAPKFISDNITMKRRVQTLSHGLAETVISHDKIRKKKSKPVETELVQFIHQSVKDFFIEKGLSILDGNSLSTDAVIRTANWRLSRICIRYLKMKEIMKLDRSAVSAPRGSTFLKYAKASWVPHTKQCDTMDFFQDDLLELFAWPANGFVEDRNPDVLSGFDYIPMMGFHSNPSTSLTHMVAKHGIIGLLRNILQKSAEMAVDIDQKDGRYRTPLAHAAASGRETAVQLLLETGKVDVNSKDDFDRTLLMHAAEHGHKAVLQRLLGTGKVEIDSKDISDRTPLSYAAKGGYKAVLRLLLDTGKVEIDSKDVNGQTPLSLAAQEGHEDIVRLLLDTGKVEIDSKDNTNRTPLSWAAEMGHKDIVRLLMDTGKVEIDLKNNYGQTPLSWAAEKGHKDIVRLLLDTGKVEVDSKDKYGQTPLSWAAEKGHKDVVQLLLDTGKVEIDSKHKYGQTPLSWAADRGQKAVVRLLLDTGKVEIDSKDSDGRTPLSWAADRGHKAVVRLLLDTGKVEIDSKDKYGQTPLIWAVGRGHKAVIRLLLDTGKVEIDSKDSDGRTPLWYAILTGNTDIVKLLLDTGRADVNSEDMIDRRAIEDSDPLNREAMVELLLSYGATWLGEDRND